MIDLKKGVLLSSLTTFKTGGSAGYFVEASNEEQIVEAVNFAKENSLDVFVLGGGSNVIVSSKGFPGVVIKPKFESTAIIDGKLHVGATVTMKQAVDFSIDSSFGGLEWAGGLPGTVGGAIRGNAGCFGMEMKDVASTVTSFDYKRRKKYTRKNMECKFGYRESYFKHNPHEVIISAVINLSLGDKEALRRVADDHIQYRQDKHPMEYPSAGSIFKNTPVERVPKDVLPEFESLIKNDPFPVIPTAAIIARADCQGIKVGDAQLSEKHTNYIVNLGSATGEDIVAVIEEVKKRVRDKYKISLEIEPQLLGFD